MVDRVMAAVARRVVLGGAVALALSTTSACDLSGTQARGEDMVEETEAPGWLAIDAALNELYPGVEPLHLGTIQRYVEGGPDPLDGISIYRVDEPLPHWHFVTYGFSELYEKESPRPEISGFGFELTLRVKRGAGETEPPPFAWNVLQNLARYVFESGPAFGHGHIMELNGPIASRSDTRITAIGFAPDPDLPAIETPHGRMEFLQVLGMTDDEIQAARAWDKSSFFELLAKEHPRWILDLERSSVLEDDAVRREVRRRTEEEGSSTAVVAASEQSVAAGPASHAVRWTVGASVADSIRRILPGRVPFGRTLKIAGLDGQVVLEPGEGNAATLREDGVLVLTLTGDTARSLATLIQPQRGQYRLKELPGLLIEVVPTEIRNREGEVVEVIGD
jgi:hypothetical protein